MPKAEIAELLTLRGWTRVDLASQLHVTENTVQRWFMWGQAPDGPASVLMRIWLKESRAEANGHKKRKPAVAM